MNAASELNSCCPGSGTANHPVPDTALSNPPENSSNNAGNLKLLEMISQYTRPGIAISIVQQEALYREYLPAQLPQSLNDQRVEQAHRPSGSGIVNPVNQQTSRCTKCRTPTTSATYAIFPATDNCYATIDLQHSCASFFNKPTGKSNPGSDCFTFGTKMC